MDEKRLVKIRSHDERLLMLEADPNRSFHHLEIACFSGYLRQNLNVPMSTRNTLSSLLNEEK